MARWKRRTERIPENHGWNAAPGNKIFVADRGAMQFEYPEGWVVGPGEDGSIRFFDREEADADMRLEVSLIYVPPSDWQGLPLTRLVDRAALSQDPRGFTEVGPFHELRRATLEAAWLEVSFTDPGENRQAHSRICLARGPGAYSLITLDFWPEDASHARKVWKTVLDTLKLDGGNQGRLTPSGYHRTPKPGRN